MDRIGRYKIVRELGRGAMGVVYHAIDPNIGRPVAIKTIQLGQGRKPEDVERMRERLFREARSAGMLSHPGIVTIYDVEQQGDLAYIAMEYVDGPTLDQVMNEPSPMAHERMFSILAQTAVALDYAHSKGTVHRDIKPANIMIAKDGTTKITDFGIAKIAATEHLTVTGAIVGTPHYMSPEQVQGQTVDGRSDQFSLAVIAYELMTGEKPFGGEHLTTVAYKIVAEEAALPHRLNPTLGSGIEGVLRKGLSKRPDSRYRTCQEFTESFEKACAATKGWKPMPRGGLLNAPTMAEASPGAQSKLPPPRRPRRAETTATANVRKKSSFVPFLIAVLFVAGMLAGIGWQAAPWLMPGAKPARQPAEEQPQAQQEPPKSAPASGEPKPSPMGPPAPTAQAEPPPVSSPAETKSAVEEPPKRSIEEPAKPAEPVAAARPPAETAPPPVRRPAPPQDVTVMSSPGGATATLDGNPALACRTPCALPAAPGRHSLAVTMPGYEIERREITVGSGPVEIPPVLMRTITGTLMLSSEPRGAAISVDGKKIAMVTPAQIALTPGVYTITIEKDGRHATERVEIKSGINYSKITLGQ